MRTLTAAALLFCTPMLAPAQSLFLDNVSPAIALTSAVGQSAVSIDPITGHVTVRSSAGNLTQCTSTAPPSPQITSFFPNVSQVAPGGSFSLTWSSLNTTSCLPTAGTGSGTSWASQGTLPVSGSINLTAPGTPQTVGFGLTCTNGSTNVSQSTSIIVQSGGGGGNCTAPWTPNVVAWSGVFGSAFPSHPGGRARLFFGQGTSEAVEFIASSSSNQFGSLQTSDFPGDGEGAMLMSISTTAGCFDPAVLGPNCLVGPAAFPSISWKIGSGPFQCSLTQGVKYYLNMTFGSSSGPGSGPYCAAGSCGRDLSSIPQRIGEE